MKLVLSLFLFIHVYALVDSGFVLTSDVGVKVTVFHAEGQADDKRYILFEGIKGDWNKKPVEVTVKSYDTNKMDYIFDSGKPTSYIVLAGRGSSGYMSYSASIRKPYQNFEGLYVPEVKLKFDAEALDKILEENKNAK